MSTETIRGYRIEHDINPEMARKLVDFFLDFGMMCTDRNGKQKHAVLTVSDVLRVRIKYEGMKREYIEIKELKKRNITEKHI